MASTSQHGLRLKTTPRMRECMSRVLQLDDAPDDVVRQCREHLDSDTIPWSLIKHICNVLRQRDGDAVLRVHEMCYGSGLALQSPQPRKRSAALEKRLAELRAAQQDRAYESMVADVTKVEREAESKRNAILPTARLQMAFGAHLFVTMGTLFALGYQAAKALFSDPVLHALGGVVGMALALIGETVLYIARSSIRPEAGKRYLKLLQDGGRRNPPVAAAGWEPFVTKPKQS